MDQNKAFFEEFKKTPVYSKLKQNPIAYFCAEYALTSEIPIYAGGLGVLAADYLKEAKEQQIPLVAIGIYYNDGYQTLHRLDPKGFILAPHVHTSPEEFGLSQLLDQNNSPVVIEVPIQDRNVKVSAWKWNFGTIPVYLLTTDVEGNSENDRKITDHLYVLDKETRFAQNVILGIGGSRLLERLGISPSIYHMNEGFSSLLCYEVARSEMEKRKVGFEEAKKIAAQKIVFTNHTLFTQGQDVYGSDLVSLTLSKYMEALGVSPNEILAVGAAQDSTSFSTSLLALRAAGKTNAVSHLHSKKALEIWPNNPMTPITNGVHVASWNTVASEDNIWLSHLESKRALLAKIRFSAGDDWDENSLIIGWARRFVSYKRPNALFENVERLKGILNNKQHPVKIVLSGTLHPSDADAWEFFDNLRKSIESEFAPHVVFIPGYNISLAKLLVAGSDVWLNTPIVGFEACGTSGMKAALNGVLPVSTRDGWMDEIDFYGIGWQLEDDKINESVLNVIEQNVIPLFFDRDQNNVPQKWIENMKNARNLILERYSATRMAREYIEQLYTPLLSSSQ